MADSESQHKSRTSNYKELARRISETTQTNEPIEEPLATSQRIIGRVTDGIYREPWAAFRELVVNAYDADAHHVIIETDQPSFSQIVVRDDGNGMSAETVAYVVKNIGGSSKRTAIGADLSTAGQSDPRFSPAGRPLIGKIGIGLFAVAQLTQHFQIITKRRGDPVRTSLTIQLMTHTDDERVPSGERARGDEYRAGIVSIISETVPKDERASHGTAVVLYELRPAIRRTLQSVQRWQTLQSDLVGGGVAIEEKPKYHIGVLPGDGGNLGVRSNLPWQPADTPATKFKALFEAAGEMSGRGSRGPTLQHFDEYLRLIWKLSLSIPIEYISDDPFDIDARHGLLIYNVPATRGQAQKVILQPREKIRDHFLLTSRQDHSIPPFSVTFDGVLLRRPIRLPYDLKAKRSRVAAPVMMVAKEVAPFSSADLKLAGGELEFEAYLYWNNRIVPKDNAGVLIRVHEASGSLFDQSFLNYQISEQTRLRQITAEIFVKKGLDGAINIDRESYNFSHPHFLYLKMWLHKALRLLVNRLKALASENLEQEKSARRTRDRDAVTQHALNVWSSRRGEDADSPCAEGTDEALPSDVGGVDMDWAWEGRAPTATTRVLALAIVLEAYGILSALTVEERTRIVSDILRVFEEID